MKNLIFAALPLFALGCAETVMVDGSGGGASFGDSQSVERPDLQPGGQSGDVDSVNTPYVPVGPGDGFTRPEAANFTSQMITAGLLDGQTTEGQATRFGNMIDFRFDVYTSTGWAMLSGSTMLPPGFEGGVIDMSDDYTLGCAGPQPGSYDFDGGADEGEIEVIIDAQSGEASVRFDFDFGSAGQMIGTAPLLDADQF